DLRFAAEQVQETSHRGDAVDHSLVHADINDVRAVLDLLAGPAHGFRVFSFLDELRELRRTRDVRALADHDERAGLLSEWERAGKSERKNGRRVLRARRVRRN